MNKVPNLYSDSRSIEYPAHLMEALQSSSHLAENEIMIYSLKRRMRKKLCPISREETSFTIHLQLKAPDEWIRINRFKEIKKKESPEELSKSSPKFQIFP